MSQQEELINKRADVYMFTNNGGYIGNNYISRQAAINMVNSLDNTKFAEKNQFPKKRNR